MTRQRTLGIFTAGMLVAAIMMPILGFRFVCGDGDQPIAVLAIDKVYDSTRAGETVLINVTLINVTECSGWNIKLAWNSNIAVVSDLIEGPFFRQSGDKVIFSIASLDNSKGEIIVAEVFLNAGHGPSVNGTGTILSINFTMVNVGITPIDFMPISPSYNGSVLADARNMHALDVIEVNGLLTVKEPRIEPARFYIDPPKVTDVALLPDTSFNVSVKVDEIPLERGLTFAQFNLTWDSSLLEAVSLTEVMFHEATPEGEWNNIQSLTLAVNNTAGEVEYSQCFYDLARAVQNGYAPMLGNHTVATITFKVKGVGECPLSIVNLVLLSHNLTSEKDEPVPYGKTDGVFHNLPPPKPSFMFRVDPSRVTSGRMLPGQTFSISINLDSLNAKADLAGVQFDLTWDPTVLEAINMTEIMFHEITPGSEWANIWIIQNEINNTRGSVSYACTFYDINLAESKGYSPIMGNHTLATATFRVLRTGESPLHFKNCMIGDAMGNPLLSLTVDGHFKNVVMTDLNGDNAVDIMDAILASRCFGSCVGDPNWNPAADFDENGIIDIYDVITLAASFGQPV